MALSRFTIRVYGILEHRNQLLLVEEKINNFQFTKFPGGGLELGEGIKDCLIREFKEETGLDIEAGDHLYTTDFFQQSAFRQTDQLVAVYYKVKVIGDVHIRLDEHEISVNGRSEWLRFFWMPKDELNEKHLTFPIDKHVWKHYL